jgi:hypothetical protein
MPTGTAWCARPTYICGLSAGRITKYAPANGDAGKITDDNASCGSIKARWFERRTVSLEYDDGTTLPLVPLTWMMDGSILAVLRRLSLLMADPFQIQRCPLTNV